MRWFVSKKDLLVIVDPDKRTQFRLSAAKGRFFVVKGLDGKPEVYLNDTKRQTLVDYPFNFPRFFQITLPLYIFARGKIMPLDPVTVSALPEKEKSSREVASLTQQHVIDEITEKVTEGETRKKTWKDFILPIILIAIVVILLIMVWQLKVQVSGLR